MINTAGKQSREVMETYKCMNCYAEMSVSNRKEYRMDGRSCFLCDGLINKVKSTKPIGSFYVDIDCSDALKGLKAVQREARNAAKELREVESLSNRLYPGD